jgi:hypothetical protein
MNADKFVSSFMMKLLFMREADNFMQDNISLEQMVLTVFDKLVKYLEDEYLPDLWSFRKPYSEHTGEVHKQDMSSYGEANVLVGSKRDIKHCLQVARLLRFLSHQHTEHSDVIRKAIEQDGHCTYATLHSK